jgi:hypothetical protein
MSCNQGRRFVLQLAVTQEELLETDRRPHESQSDDESHVADSLAITPSDKVEHNDVVHVAGDIVHVRLFLFRIRKNLIR